MLKHFAFLISMTVLSAAPAVAATTILVPSLAVNNSYLGGLFTFQPAAEPPLYGMFTMSSGDFDPSSGRWTGNNYQEGYVYLTLASGNSITLDRWAVQPTQAAAYIFNFRTGKISSNPIASGVLHRPDGSTSTLQLSCYAPPNYGFCDGQFAFHASRCSLSMHADPGAYYIDFTHQNGGLTRWTLNVAPSSLCSL